MSTHNIGFYEDLTKLSLNYYQISSNTHLISSADTIFLISALKYIVRVLVRTILTNTHSLCFEQK